MTEEVSRDQQVKLDRLEPWMEDGNIVLAVEGKHFRVHRSVLSANSEVFKYMFECPGLNEGDSKKELIEQCSVVRLHDDVADMQMVLKAMYDRSYPVPFYEKLPLASVSTFLRLGEKYDMQQLLREAKARLCCAFECTLSRAACFSSSYNGVESHLFPKITNNDPHNFQIMNLLQAMDLQALLPLTMYLCVVACPLKHVVDGYEFKGTTYTLSRQNLQSFIRMKNIVETLRTRLAQDLCVAHSCVVQSSCALSIHRLWSDDAAIKQPLGAWRSEWDKLFCNACKSGLRTRRNLEIQFAWGQIPTAFGFNSWAEVSMSGDFPRVGDQLKDGLISRVFQPRA